MIDPDDPAPPEAETPTRRTTIALLTGMIPLLQRNQPTQMAPALPGTEAPRAKLDRLVDVDDFRRPDDTDDSPAFARAVAALAKTGGEIRLDPRRRYNLSRGITIASARPIAITGGNSGQIYDASGPGVAITAPMAFLFMVKAPRTRGEHGGIAFRNVSFYDATGHGGIPGSNTVSGALLDLHDAAHSVIENCQFHFIAGCVIRTDFFVQSSILGCRIRYCGGHGAKVLHLAGTDSTFANQSVTIQDTRMEVCYGAAYLAADGTSQSVTLSACTFEASTDEYPASSTPFLDLDGHEYKLIGCTFNRNRAVALYLRGRGIVTACSFETGDASTESILILGSRNILSANSVSDTRRGNSIRVTGVLNLLLGNRFFASGGVRIEGAGNQFHDNVIDSPTMSEGGYFLTLADHCGASGNHFSAYDYAGSGAAPAVNGVALYGQRATFTGNSCRDWSGKTFVRVENATATFQPNVHDGIGTFVSVGVPLDTVAATTRLVLPEGARVVTVTGTTPIGEITVGAQWSGCAVTLVFTGRAVVAASAGTGLSRPFVATPCSTLTLASDGRRWFESGRSGER